jgi:hypothetical protein
MNLSPYAQQVRKARPASRACVPSAVWSAAADEKQQRTHLADKRNALVILAARPRKQGRKKSPKEASEMEAERVYNAFPRASAARQSAHHRPPHRRGVATTARLADCDLGGAPAPRRAAVHAVECRRERPDGAQRAWPHGGLACLKRARRGVTEDVALPVDTRSGRSVREVRERRSAAALHEGARVGSRGEDERDDRGCCGRRVGMLKEGDEGEGLVRDDAAREAWRPPAMRRVVRARSTACKRKSDACMQCRSRGRA